MNYISVICKLCNTGQRVGLKASQLTAQHIDDLKEMSYTTNIAELACG